ncbi:DUF6480 family protein [Streptomyces nitrosporeus]|uniref:Uncharacterized protein n=1 Tax=Streptomyces nitrosporeus TaxID=28894 RepID=A0A5J6FHW0_9ACTN|nr:DUF6480 family protein [Streptomyces nitrosporeus]QEU76189.1 hypothetical protein CP967_33210 [Streptomyces nitrosporeus]GGZ08565.1 hypothetical protein GCM10010327_43920 [Streptomyces nitrosporeus]
MAISHIPPGAPAPARRLTPPGETPPAEGSISEAHQERADGGVWEHPVVWAVVVLLGSLVVAGYFVARILSFP